MLPLAIKDISINTVTFTIYTSVAGVLFTFLCLELLAQRGWSKLKTKDNLLLTYMVSFGTVLFYMSTTGIVVHTSQALTFTFLALATFIILSNHSQLLPMFYWTGALSGFALGLAMLARPHIGVAGLFIVGIAYQQLKGNNLYSKKSFFYWSLSFSIPIGLIILGMFWYNQARFGSPLDFGYAYMNVHNRFISRIEEFGLFHPTYLWSNFKANFLNLPYWSKQYSRIMFTYAGLSIFFVTPVMFYLGKSVNKNPWVIGAWASTILIIGVHLMYYNSGWIQFGYRFSLDFMVPATCLLAVSMKNKIPKSVFVLFYYSTAINYIGVLWNAR